MKCMLFQDTDLEKIKDIDTILKRKNIVTNLTMTTMLFNCK
jgi:hypothetical protein